eukprot:CAMPEP_0184467382 /NCGR_PEP_ID=MMETSP0740-20130409/71638_1 /TAXON_ID=385413 /ORGANISM="Thalassiosira miniscula, Strain CCMP1093" /LENGTH=57 /DNA_ID=CAMNT_0026842689 /DNA_START=48 /DNA_END=221 /DNA_ORIENTATION=+
MKAVDFFFRCCIRVFQFSTAGFFLGSDAFGSGVGLADGAVEGHMGSPMSLRKKTVDM